jgi:hypothetical protein
VVLCTWSEYRDARSRQAENEEAIAKVLTSFTVLRICAGFFPVSSTISGNICRISATPPVKVRFQMIIFRGSTASSCVFYYLIARKATTQGTSGKDILFQEGRNTKIMLLLQLRKVRSVSQSAWRDLERTLDAGSVQTRLCRQILE